MMFPSSRSSQAGNKREKTTSLTASEKHTGYQTHIQQDHSYQSNKNTSGAQFSTLVDTPTVSI